MVKFEIGDRVFVKFEDSTGVIIDTSEEEHDLIGVRLDSDGLDVDASKDQLTKLSN